MALCLVVFAAMLTYMLNHSALLLAAVLGYVAFCAFGLGTGVWVCLSELFRNRIRGRAMSIADMVLWVMLSCVTVTFSVLSRCIPHPASSWDTRYFARPHLPTSLLTCRRPRTARWKKSRVAGRMRKRECCFSPVNVVSPFRSDCIYPVVKWLSADVAFLRLLELRFGSLAESFCSAHQSTVSV